MNFAVDPGSPVPLHHQVEQVLAALLQRPGYRDGKLLPPETELAMRLGVSRSTLRAGMDKLVTKGLLVRRRGHGTRVAPPSARTSRMESWESFTREMARQGITVETFSCRYRLTAPPGDAVAALATDPRRRVYELERVRGFDGKPVVHFHSWFHPRLNLKGTEDLSLPLYEMLEAACHVRPQHSHERLTAVAANAALSRALRVRPGTPLLRRERRVTDPGGRPVEYAVNHYRSDCFNYLIDIERIAP